VFPVTYRILLHAMIYLFVITLAVSLRVDGFYETPLLIAISTAFFLLEKTATHMQDPFENRPTDTAMTSIARTIEINLKQMIDDKEVPLPCKADKFFLN
jgi:putative membrane protein